MLEFLKFTKKEKVLEIEPSPMVAIHQYLQNDNLTDLENYVHEHYRDIHTQEIERILLLDIELYIEERFKNIEANDETGFNDINRILKLHIVPEEILKNDSRIKKAMDNAIQRCTKDNNQNFVSRINNVFYTEAA